MIFTFFGHSDFQKTEEIEKKFLEILQQKVGNKPCEMYLGGYGNFDSFAYECCLKYKDTHPNISLVFITPYLSTDYQKSQLESQKSRYDAIIYPEIENIPPKFAITHRNRFMVDAASCIIACIEREWGGAYTAYNYAKRKSKEIINLATF